MKSFKFFIIFLVITFLVNGLVLPSKTEAITSIVFDPSALAQSIVDLGQNIARWVKEDLMKGLRDVLAKRILDYIVDQTVQWIQGGGKPKFVTNWDGFLKDVGNIAFDQVIKDVGLARLCSPFAAQLRISLLPVQRFTDRISCTLDQVVSNINNFYVDFSQGGWIAYNTLWEPQNNYYGAQLLVADQVLIETARRTEAAKSEAIAGGGFLNVKRCIEYNDAGDCVKDETTTPGSIVGKTIGEAVTSDIKWAANIQSWTAALINAAINRLIKEGLSGMSSAASGGGSSYRPPEYVNPVSQELERQKQILINDLQQFLNEEQYLLNAKNRSLSAAQLILVELQKLQSSGYSVSAAEIQLAQAEINRLNAETTALQNNVNELAAVISRIQQASTIAALAEDQVGYSAVFEKYNTPAFRLQIIEGNVRAAYDQEASQKQAELQAVLNRSSGSSGGDTGR